MKTVLRHHDRPLSPAEAVIPLRLRLLASCIAGLLFGGWLVLSRSERGPLRIDEGHRLAETHFFQLLLEGDFSNTDWVSHIVDRTNPPLPKYFFGAAIRLQGAEIPPLGIRVEERKGLLSQQLKEGAMERYRPSLLAMRRGVILLSTLTAGLVFFIAITTMGWSCGLLAALFYVTHDLTLTFASTAIADPLLTLMILGGFIPARALLQEDPTRKRTLLALTLLWSGAVLTRLSGVISPMIVLPLIARKAWVKRSVKPLVMFVVACFATLLLTTALNPYYWSPATPAGMSVSTGDPLPLRLVHRYAGQAADLVALTSALRSEGFGRPSFSEKISFFSETLFGDLAGLALAAGLLFAALLYRRAAAGERIVILWSALLVFLLVAGLPFLWPRYLLAAVPPLSLIAASGWILLLRYLRSNTRVSRA